MSLFSGKRSEDDAPKGDAGEATSSPKPAASGARRPPIHQEGTRVANIGKSISIRGDLTGNEDMVIEGQVEGKVDLPNNQLTIGADGKVKAEIHAKSVVIVGHVLGNVIGLERVEIQATSWPNAKFCRGTGPRWWMSTLTFQSRIQHMSVGRSWIFVVRSSSAKTKPGSSSRCA